MERRPPHAEKLQGTTALLLVVVFALTGRTETVDLWDRNSHWGLDSGSSQVRCVQRLASSHSEALHRPLAYRAIGPAGEHCHGSACLMVRFVRMFKHGNPDSYEQGLQADLPIACCSRSCSSSPLKPQTSSR